MSALNQEQPHKSLNKIDLALGRTCKENKMQKNPQQTRKDNKQQNNYKMREKP